MLDRIRAMLDGAAGPAIDRNGSAAFGQTELAAAALLVEAARLDENFDRDEWLAIRAMLREQFDISEAESESLIAAAEEEVEGTAEIYRFARIVKDQYGPEERIKIVEMLWRVVYADGAVHDYETNLLRRVAGLIYVSDRDSGIARKKVLAELNLAEQ